MSWTVSPAEEAGGRGDVSESAEPVVCAERVATASPGPGGVRGARTPVAAYQSWTRPAGAEARGGGWGKAWQQGGGPSRKALTRGEGLLELVGLVGVGHAEGVEVLGAPDLELGHTPGTLDLRGRERGGNRDQLGRGPSPPRMGVHLHATLRHQTRPALARIGGNVAVSIRGRSPWSPLDRPTAQRLTFTDLASVRRAVRRNSLISVI